MAVEIATKPVTESTLLALGEDTRAEVLKGEIVIDMSPNRVDHSFYAQRIASYLDVFVSARGLGRVFGDMASYILQTAPDGAIERMIVPDASYVSFEHLPPDASMDRMLPMPPDLAVEVISDSEATTDVVQKTSDYLDAGVEAVWLILPRRREVRVCTPDQRVGKVYGEKDDLPGEPVLNRFSVPVRAIFEDANTSLHASVLRRLMQID